MELKYLTLFLLSILPILSKYFFWLYTVQLKEYRLDRFKEYLSTPQGIKALFNYLIIVEIPVLFFTIGYFFDKALSNVLLNVVLGLLLLQSLIVLIKIIKNKIFYPKITSRLIFTVFIIILLQIIIYFILDNPYFYILLNLSFSLLFILLSIFISLPLVSYLKNKKINKAINISKIKNNPIKVGITGSYGKSSVKEYLVQILSNDGQTLSTPKNINTELGVSDLIINKLKNKYKYFVAEMGAYKIGEIKLLGEIVDHKYGFLTAIGNQHLALFGGIKNTIKAKCEIAEKVLENDGILYANYDNKYIKKHKFDKKLNLVSYAIDKKAQAKSEINEENPKETKFTFYYKGRSDNYTTNLIGKHNILNLTGVLAFCYDIGIDKKLIKNSLKDLVLPDNTLKIIKSAKYSIIDDSYNLSEGGLISGLEVMNKYSKHKSRVLIIDDILELGEESSKIHFDIGKKIAKEKLVDKVFYVGVNYKEDFVKGLVKGGISLKNSIKNIDEIDKKSIILLEGRKSGLYLKKLIGEEQL